MKKNMLVLLLLLPLFLVQCVSMIGNVHSAKTLEPGVSSISLSVDGGAVIYSFIDSLVDASDTAIPPLVLPTGTILPNVNFKVGITENTEIGVNLAPQILGFEATVKHRFYQSMQNHFAVAPYFQYYLLWNYSGGAHLVYTREIMESLLLNVSAYTSYTYMDNVKLLDEEIFRSRHFINFGGIFAPQICGESFFLIPSFEYVILIPLQSDENLSTAYLENIQHVRGGISFGWYVGKVKKQLNRMERKIDAINEKLDRQR